MMNGLDWRPLGLIEYFTRLDHWSLRHSDEPTIPAADPRGSERMRRAMAAQKMH